MDVDKLWGSRVPDSTDDILVRGHWLEHVFESHLGLAIDFGNLWVFKIRQAAAAWVQPCLSQNFYYTALFALLDEFRFIRPAAQIQRPSTFVIPPTLWWWTRWHHVTPPFQCSTASGEAPRVIGGLVAELAASLQVHFFINPPWQPSLSRLNPYVELAPCTNC